MGKAYWFVFCKSDILLKDNGDGTFDIPYGEKPPVDMKEWNHILNISPMNDGSLVKSVRIDSPVTESVKYVMCGLRASYYKLERLGNAMNCYTGTTTPNSAVHVELQW